MEKPMAKDSKFVGLDELAASFYNEERQRHFKTGVVDVVLPGVELLDDGVSGVDILKRLERIIRVAYKSEDKITEDSHIKMLNIIMKNQHLSTLEHYHFTFKFVTNRAIANELVRHRLCNYTQESTRYVNYEKKGAQVVYPSHLARKNVGNAVIWYETMHQAILNYNGVIDEYDWTPEEARGILPLDLKTELYMTTNIREFLHINSLRGEDAPTAHKDIRVIISEAYKQMNVKLPLLFPIEVLDAVLATGSNPVV